MKKTRETPNAAMALSRFTYGAGTEGTGEKLCPADRRIQEFLDRYLADLGAEGRTALPSGTFLLDRPGLARELSLPADGNEFVSDIVRTYRVSQGVLHNPASDRRTTQGVFHVAEGGLPIPDDKIAVPKAVFAKLLREAFRAPASLLRLPYTSGWTKPSEIYVSLLLRPMVCPAVPGAMPHKSMEIRFFAPGSLIGNLDFVESIFGNGGNPLLKENDAALDAEHWSGHTGCVVLAPHLTGLTKKELGLPAYEAATERQRRDGQCWKKPDELYNGGSAFKVTARTLDGVIVTVIADNYFGYCKKEVKTQISFAANLYGLAEEEHSGGALAFAAYDLGEEFKMEPTLTPNLNAMEDVFTILGERVEKKHGGYGIDRKFPGIVYVPSESFFSLRLGTISWPKDGRETSIKLLADTVYVLPSGYRVYIKKQTGGKAWHLIGIVPEAVMCHKPCTVSGGGKSEISKSIVDAMIQGPVFIADIQHDLLKVAEILARDYGRRFQTGPGQKPSRPVLSPERSLGSVIKLFTVSEDYTDEFNAWLRSIPDYVKEILFTVKRFHKPDWGEDWQSRFSVDVVNGQPGHELKFNGQKLIANYLRVGREKDGSWRIFRVRQDFASAEKVQTADDITVSVTVPAAWTPGLNPKYANPSVKLIENCENLLFQRPDDAVYRGYDKQAEADIASDGVFLSNFEPLDLKKVREIVEDAVHFDQFTEPMKARLLAFLKHPDGFVASSAHPRLVNGKPTKNPRYLQRRPDRVNPMRTYLAEISGRLRRRLPTDAPLFLPVNAVLPGRRMNPPDRKEGLPALAVYNPIHYQELPELFMDFISSLTGKSPSTTGFGSEGALTKGPFNALWPVVDLNNALVSYIMTGYHGFSSAAGFIGPNYRVDHDVSLLMPEIWCRMRAKEQNPRFLIDNQYLEKVNDYSFKGRTIRASLLGYRINKRFVNAFLGRVFSNPNIVFTDDMLAPERQDPAMFAEGIENIVSAMQRVADHYYADGSVRAACPPLQALLAIMREGRYEGRTIEDPEVRRMFTREAVIESDWYRRRLESRRQRERGLWARHAAAIEQALQGEAAGSREASELLQKLGRARLESSRIDSAGYLESLSGTIGADPFTSQF